MNQQQIKDFVVDTDLYVRRNRNMDMEVTSTFDDATSRVKVSLAIWEGYDSPRTLSEGYLEPAGTMDGREMLKFSHSRDNGYVSFLIEAKAELLFGLLYM